MQSRNEISIHEFIKRGVSLFRFLLSKWLIIGLVAFVFGLAGILYAWMQKKVYTAEMSFVTETESGGPISGYAGIAAQFGIDLGGGGNTLFEGENLIELLRSRTMVIQSLISPCSATDQRLMIERYLEINQLDKKGATRQLNFREFGTNENRVRDSVLLMVTKKIQDEDLSIRKRDKKLSIIDMSFSSIDEEFAKNFTEQLASNAIRYYTDYKVRKSRQNVEILERQMDSVKRVLFSGISDVATLNDLNVNPLRQTLKTGTQRRQVDVQTSGAVYTELVKNLELSRLALRRETPLIQIIDRPVLPLKVKGIGRLKAGLIAAFAGGMLTIMVLLFGEWIRRQSLQKEI